jgi:hypothetical protein
MKVLLLVKLAAFTLSMLPLLIENLAFQTASNRSNAILFIAGLAFASYALATGLADPSFGLFGGWLLIITGSIALAFFGLVSGGVAKTFAALAPWVSVGEFVTAFAIGMLAVGLIGHVKGRTTVGIVAPLYLAICGNWIFAA